MDVLRGPRHVVIQAEAGHLDLSTPPRADGYRRLATALQTWGSLLKYPVDDRFWYVIGCARRLDTAHRQLERVREGLDAATEARARRRRNLEWIDESLAVLGDAELSMIALYRALKMASELEGTLGPSLKRTFPTRLSERRVSIKELRDAYEHIEHRAIGKISLKGPPGDWRAHGAFSRAGEELQRTRRIRYRKWSIGIYSPATALCIDLRDWLRGTWMEMCGEEWTRRQPVP